MQAPARRRPAAAAAPGRPTKAMERTRRSARTALSVAAAVRGEDRLTKRAEEQAGKVRNPPLNAPKRNFLTSLLGSGSRWGV